MSENIIYNYKALNFVNSNSKIPSYLCAFVKFIFETVGHGSKNIKFSTIANGFSNFNKKELDNYENKTKPEIRKISELKKFPFLTFLNKKTFYFVENKLNFNYLKNIKLKNKEVLNNEIDSTLILLLLNRELGLNFYFELTKELNKLNIKFNIEFLILILGFFKENNEITISNSLKIISEVQDRYNSYIKNNKNVTLKSYIKNIFLNEEYNIKAKYKTCEDYAVTSFYYLEKTKCFNLEKNFAEKYLTINLNYMFKIKYFLDNTIENILNDINSNKFVNIYNNIDIEKYYVDMETNLNNPYLINIDKLYKEDYNWAEFECRNVMLFCQKLYSENKDKYKSYEKKAAIKLNSIKKPTSTTSGVPDLYIKTEDLTITIEPCNSNTILQLCNNEAYSCKKHLMNVNSNNTSGICFVITPKKLKEDNDYEQQLSSFNLYEFIEANKQNRKSNFIINLSEKEFIDLLENKNIIESIKEIYSNESKRWYTHINNIDLRNFNI